MKEMAIATVSPQWINSVVGQNPASISDATMIAVMVFTALMVALTVVLVKLIHDLRRFRYRE